MSLRAAGGLRYWWIWIAVLPAVAWALVRCLSLDSGFPVATLMAFTPFAAIAAFLLAGVAVALRNWPAAFLAALATLALALAVLPRALGDGTVSAAGHPTLRVLAANIHRGTADPEALVALVDRLHPDVLSIEELTVNFARELEELGLERRLPRTMLEVDKGASGGGLYSRYPLRELPSPPSSNLPNGRRMPRAELSLPGGARVRVVSVHPEIPGVNSTGTWEAALAALPSAGAGAPWVLAGDFNATLDESALRDLVDRGYGDAGEVAGKGLESTFPAAGHYGVLPVTIDHVLADQRLGIVSYSVEEIPGSDHHAVFAELALP